MPNTYFQDHDDWSLIFVSKTWLGFGQESYRNKKIQLLVEIDDLRQSYGDVLGSVAPHSYVQIEHSLELLKYAKAWYIYRIDKYFCEKLAKQQASLIASGLTWMLSQCPEAFSDLMASMEAFSKKHKLQTQ